MQHFVCTGFFALLIVYAKLIPQSPNGLDVLIPLVTHFAAEFLYVGVDGAGVAKIIVIPHAVQDFFA